MTDDQRARWQVMTDRLRAALRPGGKPTNLTWRLTGSRTEVSDIGANNVTHVNRDPIEVFLDPTFADVVGRSREMVTKAGRL